MNKEEAVKVFSAEVHELIEETGLDRVLVHTLSLLAERLSDRNSYHRKQCGGLAAGFIQSWLAGATKGFADGWEEGFTDSSRDEAP